MDLSGWELDLPAVYGDLWKKRAPARLAERLYESPDGRWAVLLFGLAEVGMNKQAGPLALFRDKTAPVLVYHSGTTAFWYEGTEGEPVVFSPDGRGARVVEFLRLPRGRFDGRERTLDFGAASLVPLASPPPSLRDRWQSFRATRKLVASLVSALLAAVAVAPLFLFAAIVLEHRRDAQMSTRGRELSGRVIEFSGSGPDFEWSRVRVEAGRGSTTDFVLHERLPVGREVTLLQDPLSGEVRDKEDVVRGLSSWPWDLVAWLVLLSPLYIGIPWMFRRLGRTPTPANPGGSG